MFTTDIIELLAIGFTAFLGQIGVFSSVWYLYRRNIFIQKILYLNDQLRNLNEDSLIKFRIGRHVKFRPHISYEEHYPPPIKLDNLNNPDYQNLHENFYKLSRRFEKMVKKLGLIYVIGMSVLGLFYLMSK